MPPSQPAVQPETTAEHLTEPLAIHGGTPCVVDHPASLVHGPAWIGEEEIAEVTQALRGQNLFRFHRSAESSPTAQFEAMLCESLGVEHALAVNSGTSALICAMVGLGVEPGDEVIVPGYTYIATAAAALSLGAFPVIAEIDASLTLDPADAESKITDRTKLICPVHMRGIPARMDRFVDIAQRHPHIKILEDVAQANGGKYKGRPLGSWGHAAAFSLQHYKVITAGEGGAFVTNDREIFHRGAFYHDSAYTFWMEKQGQDAVKPFLGQNFRLSELNGALVLSQMRKRDQIIDRCRMLRNRMRDTAGDLPGLTLQDVPDWDGDCGICLGYFAQTPERAKALAEALGKEGMAAQSIYSKSIPDRHIYTHWDYVLEKRTPFAGGWPWHNPARPCQVQYHKEMCPKTLDHLGRVVVMPISQQMSEAHVDSCAKALQKVAAQI